MNLWSFWEPWRSSWTSLGARSWRHWFSNGFPMIENVQEVWAGRKWVLTTWSWGPNTVDRILDEGYRIGYRIKDITIIADFNLSGGCFGTDIIQNCTKWSNIGVHGLSFGPIFAKFQCASFLLRKSDEKWPYGQNKHKNVVFHATKSLRSYMPHTKVGKNKCSDIIHPKLAKFIIYNHVSLIFIKNNIKVCKFGKQMLNK